MQWQAAIYLRLSRDDGLEGVSESIKNQQTFLENYAAENEIAITNTYTDDGFSGTTFERPAFNQMIQDIEIGKINCVITKDLSRLGRDYIMTGHYLERYFPEHGVRYIAVTDGIDTFASISSNDMGPFKAVFNDMYAKDISKKVRTAIATKREQGKFIGATAPYGYKKDSNDKNHLVIDPETAVVVGRIFAMALGGESYLGIANRLSAEGIKTPSEQKGLTSTQQRWSGVWNDGMIKRILTNETYIGNLVQNRTRKINYKINKKIVLPQSEWVVVPKTHEPIVSTQEFEQVQRLVKNRQYTYANRKGTPHLLSGVVFCEDCGAPMSFVKESDIRSYLVCSTWRKHSRLHLCTSHCIREKIVEDEVKNVLQNLAKEYADFDDILESVKYDFKNEKKELQHCKAQLEATKKILLSLYKDKVLKEISQENYTMFSKELNEERVNLQGRIQELEEQITNGEGSNFRKNILKELLTFDHLDRTTLLTFLKKITINDQKVITMELNCTPPL